MSMKLNRRAFLGTALTFGALCSVSPADAFGVTAAEKKQEVQAIKAKLDSMLDELDQAVDQYNAAQDAYEKATAKVDKAKEQIKEAQSKIDTLQGHLATRATSMYRTGSMSYLDVLLGVGSFDDFATVWDTLNTLNEDDADLVTETKQAKAKLEAAKKELDEQQATAADSLAEAKAYHKSIQSMTNQYESEYNSLSAEYRKLLKEEEEAEAKRRAQAAAAYRPHTNSNSSNSGGSSNNNSGGSSNNNSGGSSNNNSGGSSNNNSGGSSNNNSGGSSNNNSGGSSIPTNGGVVDYARSRIGCPYVWGAAGPNSFDCSGLTMWCYAKIGISMSHYTESQYAEAKARMSVYSASAGDILYRSGHVAIYSGGDNYIHSPHTGAYVCETSGIGSFSAALRF